MGEDSLKQARPTEGRERKWGERESADAHTARARAYRLTRARHTAAQMFQDDAGCDPDKMAKLLREKGIRFNKHAEQARLLRHPLRQPPHHHITS